MYKFRENSYKNWPRNGSFIMWMLGEREENDHSLLIEQARDIADKNFTGVLAVPRAGTLDIRHPDAIQLLKSATHAAKKAGLEVWLMADPRLASDSLIHDIGEALEVVIPFELSDANPEFTHPGPRPTHMHQGGCIKYEYLGFEKVYRVVLDGENKIAGWEEVAKPTVSGKFDVQDRHARLLAFPKYRTNFFDYSNPGMWAFWEEYVETLFKEIDGFSGLCWDEPGFYCDGSRFPFSEHIVSAFRDKYGYEICENLIWLICNAPDSRHIKVRNDYFELLNDIISESMKNNSDLINSLAVSNSKFVQGIHATWHGEFCGIEERNHGSMDLWKLRPFQTAGFTDIGGCEKLMQPGTGSDIIYSLVLARSLSRMGPNPDLIWSNLWGIDFGSDNDISPPEIIEYWADLIWLFGARWLAHGYGWPGTRFTDLNFGPGYPDHPSWELFKEANDKLLKRDESESPGRQVSDMLVIFPLESFYSVGMEDHRTETWNFVRLIDKLTRLGYQIDIVSSSWITGAILTENAILLNDCEYKSLVLPHCLVIDNSVHDLVGDSAKAGLPVIAGTARGGPVYKSGIPAKLPAKVIQYPYDENPIELINETTTPTFVLPNGALANAFRTQNNIRIKVIADEPFGKFSGIFKYGPYEIKIDERSDPFAIELPVN